MDESLNSSQRERDGDTEQHIAESSASGPIVGNAQLGSLTTIQCVGECENVTEGVVTGSN